MRAREVAVRVCDRAERVDALLVARGGDDGRTEARDRVEGEVALQSGETVDVAVQRRRTDAELVGDARRGSRR